jgi:hypothetical protein
VRPSADGKVTHEWVAILDGSLVTIYDYKWVAKPGRRERFHVGGHGSITLLKVQLLFPNAVSR